MNSKRTRFHFENIFLKTSGSKLTGYYGKQELIGYKNKIKVDISSVSLGLFSLEKLNSLLEYEFEEFGFTRRVVELWIFENVLEGMLKNFVTNVKTFAFGWLVVNRHLL